MTKTRTIPVFDFVTPVPGCPAATELPEAVSRMANSLLDGRNKQLKMLEAGCGSASHVTLNAELHTVGIDISKEALERNSVVQEKILGDLQSYPLPSEEFDVAVCWMVLEHLSRPTDALLNLFRSVRREGLVILGFPNLFSIKGMVTKVTPQWFHVLFYRFMKYSCRPCPTYLRMAILPRNVIQLAEQNGFSVVFCRLVEGGVTQRFKSRFWIAGVLFSALDSVTQLLSLGKSQSLLLDNCAMILRKDAGKH